VDADQPLKVLFQTRPRDLLPITGDEGARVLSARVLELAAAKRSVDLVLFLKRRGARYVRHVEFQARHRADLALRCFEYATRLVARLRLPVLTTVVYLKPPAPRELVFRERLAGAVVHERRFEVVRLWELDAREALALGPGGAALVGLLGRTDLQVIGKASRQIRRQAPQAQHPDLLAILQSLSEGRYTARQLARVIPEEVVMKSSFYEKAHERGVEEGVEKGLEKGRLDEARLLRASFIKRHHSLVAARLLPAIEACTNVARLHRWTLRAPEVSSDELLRLVRRSAISRTSHRRAPRPARRARRSAAR
jgi:predicted transposase YdaD